MRHLLHVSLVVIVADSVIGKRELKILGPSYQEIGGLSASSSFQSFDAASTAQLDSDFVSQLAGATEPEPPPVRVPLNFSHAPGPSPAHLVRRTLAEVNEDAPVYKIPTREGIVSGRPEISTDSRDVG
jgi:hypothetical protein